MALVGLQLCYSDILLYFMWCTQKYFGAPNFLGWMLQCTYSQKLISSPGHPWQAGKDNTHRLSIALDVIVTELLLDY